MPNLILGDKLVPSSSNKVVAEAQNIAYSTKIENSEEVIDVSIKDKIDEIAEKADLIQDVNNIESQVEEIQRIAQDINTIDTSFDRRVESAKEEITAIVRDTASSIESINTKVNKIDSLVNQIDRSFNTDAQFQVITQARYNELLANEQIDENTMYYIYTNEN